METKESKKTKTKFLTKKKIISFAIVIVVVAIGATVLPNMVKPKPVMVATQTVEASDLEEVVSIKGELQGAEEADIYPAQSGEIKAVYVKEGDKVSKGQLLATLDAGEIANQYAKANQAINEASRKLNDAKVLYEAGAIPRNEYMEAEAAYKTAKLSLGDYDFSKTRITSPINGVVTRVRATVGSSSASKSGEAMFTIEDLDNLVLKVKISEFDIGKVNLGQKVTIKAQTLGQMTETGTVIKIYPSGEQREGSQEKIIPVDIKADNVSHKLIAGTSAKAEILIKEAKGVKSVPVEAINVLENESYVFALKNGKAKKIKVDTGIEGIFRTEIISDKLKIGDKIILPVEGMEIEDGQEVVDESGPEGMEGSK